MTTYRPTTSQRTAACLLVVSLLLAPSLVFQANAADSRAADLAKLAAAKSGPYIELSTKNYGRYVTAPGRTYDIVVVLTAGRSVDCGQCRMIDENVVKVATEYAREGESKLSGSPRPLFFAFVDILKHNAIGRLHDVDSVPVVAFVRHDFKFEPARRSPGSVSETLRIPDSIILVPSMKNQKVDHALLEWANKFSGKETQFHVPLSKRMQIAACVVIGLGLGLIAFWKSLAILSAYPAAMAGLALIVQTVAASGLCWSILHGFQLHGYGKDWGSILFSGARRSQYVVEGLLMSACCVSCGMSFYASGWLLLETEGRKSRLSRTVRTFIAFIFICCGLAAYSMVMSMHGQKNGISSSPFFPSQSTARGPLLNDRGNSL